jgi:NAD(P)-dependent dehydrogenase (short-subunit alcohol dehydrogenase family)
LVNAGNLPVALVTGGARRIGRAIVEDLSANGWAVAIHCNRSRDDAERLAQSLVSGGGGAAVVQADFADLDAASRVIDEVVGLLGRPSLLVNNASVFEADSVASLDRDLWWRQTTINFAAPIFLAKSFADSLPDHREGNVINILDERVLRPTPRNFSYQLSKSALWQATEILAQALAPRVRVNAIAPGAVLPSPYQTERQFRQLTEALVLGHGPDLAEFGRTVRFLVETRSITGQTIAVDGGQHLAWATPDILVNE